MVMHWRPQHSSDRWCAEFLVPMHACPNRHLSLEVPHNMGPLDSDHASPRVDQAEHGPGGILAMHFGSLCISGLDGFSNRIT